MKMVSTLALEGIRPKLHIFSDINPEVTDYYVCLFVCLYVCMSVCLYVCMSVCRCALITAKNVAYPYARTVR